MKKATVNILAPGGRREVVLEKDVRVTIGRTDRADIALTDDPFLSGVHLSLLWDGSSCAVHDEGSSNGTYIRGFRIEDAGMQPGVEVVAGRTRFRLLIEEVEGEQEQPGAAGGPNAMMPGFEDSTPLPASRERLLRILTTQPDPLFALLDAARDDRVLDWLKNSGEQYQSLYEGEKAQELEMFAPYLVRLHKQSPLLRRLVREAWGDSWGMYVTSAETAEGLRKHFRHFLMVEIEGGKQVYFRFYDPRVLRAYLPSCNPGEAQELTGPVKHYWMEDEDPNKLLRFHAGEKGAVRRELDLEKEDVPNP